MAGRLDLKLDYAAIGAVLRDPEMGAACADAAQAVAGVMRARGVRSVTVSTYTTDRAAASVTMSASAEGQELKYGTLTDAAESLGLEVGRGGKV